MIWVIVSFNLINLACHNYPFLTARQEKKMASNDISINNCCYCYQFINFYTCVYI